MSSLTAAQLAMEMDLSDLAALAASDPAAMTEAQMAELKKALSKTELELRMDLETGMYYIYAPILAQQTGGSGWYSMDLNELFQGSGMDLTQLMGLYKNFSLEDTLRSTLASMPLSDRDAAYPMLSASADSYVKLFSDGAFKKDGDTYKATYTMSEGGAGNITYTTVLTERDGEIASMQMDMALGQRRGRGPDHHCQGLCRQHQQHHRHGDGSARHDEPEAPDGSGLQGHRQGA